MNIFEKVQRVLNRGIPAAFTDDPKRPSVATFAELHGSQQRIAEYGVLIDALQSGSDRPIAGLTSEFWTLAQTKRLSRVLKEKAESKGRCGFDETMAYLQENRNTDDVIRFVDDLHRIGCWWKQGSSTEWRRLLIEAHHRSEVVRIAERIITTATSTPSYEECADLLVDLAEDLVEAVAS